MKTHLSKNSLHRSDKLSKHASIKHTQTPMHMRKSRLVKVFTYQNSQLSHATKTRQACVCVNVCTQIILGENGGWKEDERLPFILLPSHTLCRPHSHPHFTPVFAATWPDFQFWQKKKKKIRRGFLKTLNVKYFLKHKQETHCTS